jgi:hypothetical protein
MERKEVSNIKVNYKLPPKVLHIMDIIIKIKEVAKNAK